MGSFLKKASFGLALPFALLSLMAAQTPTTTTLSISPANYVAAGTVVTLTATVTNPGSVTAGTVDFCNADSTDCSPGSGLYGTAQLTSSGTTSILKVFGYGANNIKAVFAPTVANAGSISLTNFVTVAAGAITHTTLTAAGSPGNYTLSGAVTAFGTQPLSGVVNFLDTTNGNDQIGTSSLGASVRTYSSVTYPVGHTPYGVVAGDFNRDGKVDLAITDATDNKVSILLGNGDGTFQPQATYNVGGQPGPIAVGDFNGDGKLDLAVGNLTGQTISVLIGNGDGTFRPQVTYSTSGVTPISIAVGDFTGDGKLDIVIADYPYSTVQIMIGNGDGTFEPGLASTGTAPVALAPGHFDGSGWLEIVEYGQIGGGDILQGGSAGFFGSLPGHFDWDTYAPTYYASSIAVGDFNRDGKLDLAVTDPYDNKVTIMLGSGAASFGGEITIPTNNPLSVAVGDFNGDGKLDLAVTHPSNNTVGIILGNGDGTFQPEIGYGVGSSPYSVAVGDFNGDGISDLAVTNAAGNNVSILFSEQIANYSQSGLSAIGSGTQYVLASYLGDASNAPSQSPTVPLTGTSLLTQTISFAPIASPVTYGVPPISLSATGGGTGNPVTFSVLSGPGHVSGNWLYVDGVGTIVVAADQAGNADYSAAPEVIQSVVVNKITPTFSVSCAPNPITYGSQTTNCTATVGGSATGSVAWTINGGTWTSTGLSGGATTAGGFNGYAAGPYTIGVTYPGDSNYTSGSSSTVLTIQKAVRTAMVSCSPNPTTWPATHTTCTATVSAGGGSVNFTYNGGTPWGTPAIGGGAASIAGFDGVAAGTYPVLATASGDPNYVDGASASTNYVVNKATPTSGVSCAPNPITYGPQTTTCTIAVGGGATGAVAVTYNGTAWASPVLSSGSASVSGMNSQPAGSYSIVANYPGDANNNAASDSTTLTILQAATSMTGIIAPNPITFGQSFTVSGHVNCNSACGNLQYFIDGSPWGINSLDGSGNYAAAYGAATTGVHMIQVNYLGDANHSPSSWGPASVTVLPIATTVTVSCSPNPLTYGTSASCTAHVSGGGGTVTFTGTSSEPGPWTEPVDGSGNAVLSGFSDWPIGTYTISMASSGDANYSGAANSTAFTVIPAGPSVLMWAAGNQFESTASLSLSPVTAGNANGVTAQMFGGNSPTGTVAFTNGGTNYGTLPIQSVSATNLFRQSIDMTNSSVWGAAGEALTPNVGLAPDGTSSATQVVSTGTDPMTWQGVITGGVANQTFTASIWVKSTGGAIGKLGRIWMFPSDGSIPGCSVPETAAWTRVSCTISFGPSLGPSLTVRYDMTDAGAASGDTVLVWGPQLEASSMPGPYVPTTSAAATASQPVATAGSYVTSPGTYAVTAAYGGDGTNTAASSSMGLTAIAASPLSVMTVNPTTTPYGSPVSMSALISTGGDAPTGALNFASDGGNVASASPAPATTTNYIPFSRNFSMWTWEATNPTSVEPGTTLGPNGLPGDVATVVFPSTTGTYSGIRYTDSTTNLVGKTMTFSFWVRGDAPSALTFYLADWPYSGTFAAGNGCSVTTTWQRCSVSGTFPANANGGFYVPIRSDNQASPITIYVCGPQLEEGAAGPYVSTAGSARTALGGIATGSISTLPVGAHAMTATIAADSNLNAATSAPVTEIITAVSPTGMSVSCAPNPITYGPQTTTCTASGLPSGATGTVAFSFNGTNWANPPIASGSASASGFNGMPAGSYSILAGYSGDGNYTSASASTTLIIVSAPSSVNVSCSPNPITFGPQTTLCTAAGLPAGATGTIAWTINGGAWTTTPVAAPTAGGFSGYPVGSYTIAVAYSSDSNNIGSSSSTVLAILPAMTTTTITSSLNPSVLGQNVSWPCSVTSPDGTPTGMITYTLDGNPLGTISTTDAPWSGASLTVGAHILTCSFAAQGNFAASSGTVTQTVGIAPTVTELSSSANPIVFGGSATFTALVDTGGSVAPTSSVAFTSNGVAIGSAAVSTVTTTNLLNNSDVSTWAASGPTLTANASAAPDGTLTATHVVFPANSGCCINIGMTSSSAWVPGSAYTYSVWLRSDSNAAVQVSLRTGPGGESDTMPTMTPTWTRYTTSGTVPVGATGNVTALMYLADTPGVDYYAWGAQVEQTATAGPYIATRGAPATGSGGIATLTTTTLPAGNDTIVATYGGDAGTGTSTSTPLIEVVTEASPTITWNSPAPIVYGTPLTGMQLNATASVPGTFTYSPVTGTVLSAGSQTLSATFTPTDSADYSTQTATVTLAVNKATLTITPNSASKVYGTANPAFTGTITGLIPGDAISVGYTSAATTTTVVGVYFSGPNAISSTTSGPVNILGNYNYIQPLGTLTIAQATTTLTWTTPAPITYGTPLSGTQLNATSGGVDGTFVYAPAAGVVLIAGSHTLTVTFTPTDTVDYSSETATVALTVNQVAPTITLTSSLNPANYGTPVTFTAQTAASATGSMTFYDGGTIIGTGTISGGIATYTTATLATGPHSVTASYGGDSNYSPAVSAVLTEVITRTAATVTLTSTENPSAYGETTTFTFTATGVAGLGTPSGTVVVSDGATLLATPPLDASGVARFTTAALLVGSHTLTAVYGGDANYK